MGGRQEGMPALAVNGGPIKQPGVSPDHPQQTADSASVAATASAADATAAAAESRRSRPSSSPTPGPSSLDLGSSSSRSVAFKSNVVVVGGGGGGGAGSPPSTRSLQMHKCQSLPRLTSSEQSSPMTAVPLAFPRIHVASAMLSSSDLMLDSDQLSMAGNVGLLRSMSARTVDSLVHMDRSLASSNSGSRFLSPSGDVTTDNLAARSTSCPSMAYPMLTCRSGSHFQLRSSTGGEDGDVNLDGEEITDLPIEPTQNFPDLIPELQEDYTPDSHNGNLPLYSDFCDEQEGSATTPSRANAEPPEQRHNNNDKKAPSQGGPGSAPEGKESKQRSDGNYNVSAREKCIRWLKSLSIDKS